MGFPLACKLVTLGYEVKGSTTSPHKIPLLQNSNIIPFHLTCTNGSVNGENVADFFKCEKLFVNIPFKRDLKDPFTYVEQMKSVVAMAKKGGVKRLIFASSTSVYPLKNQTAKETDVIEPTDERSVALIQAENLFLRESQFCTTIIRFAGLYGPDREIAHFLRSDRIASKDGNSPVNLIHLDDCVGIITCALEKELCSEIINACADAHPLRKELYVHAAIAMRLSKPVFDENIKEAYKIISNDKVKYIINYRFIHPGPWGWIDYSSKTENTYGTDRAV
jgi:nucleoside-diphosphate-sugar epimerase